MAAYMVFWRRRVTFCLVGLIISGLATGLFLAAAHAANPAGGFSLEVTPSPLVTTLKPGTTTSLDIKIHNTGIDTEDLKVEPRRFKVDKTNGHITLDDAAPPEIANWISFSAPEFSIKSGQWYTQKMQIALPKEAGFSYWFALVISRAHPTDGTPGRVINGSLAVFTLINVDRPGATRTLEVEDFNSSQGVYEYLPATLNITLKNTGNSIIQPYGNVFIQHDSNSTTSLAALPVNDKKGYILPGSSRTLQTAWIDGFPTYQATTGTDGTQHTSSVWDWAKLGNFRIGRYSAKLVAVYNDGQRDVPLVREVTFWVFPWKIILGALILVCIFGLGIWSLVRGTWKVARRDKHQHRHRM